MKKLRPCWRNASAMTLEKPSRRERRLIKVKSLRQRQRMMKKWKIKLRLQMSNWCKMKLPLVKHRHLKMNRIKKLVSSLQENQSNRSKHRRLVIHRTKMQLHHRIHQHLLLQLLPCRRKNSPQRRSSRSHS